jgi:anti-sigma regulatory factor (Ser/Thr protein kinase)
MSLADQNNTKGLALVLPCDALAPSATREALEEFDELDWILGDVMLVASELVTNAVLHSGCASEDDLQVEVALDPERIKISVSDPGRSGEVARQRTAGEFADGGWGLQVVEQLSLRWGTRREGAHQVWAELDRTGGGSALPG